MLANEKLDPAPTMRLPNRLAEGAKVKGEILKRLFRLAGEVRALFLCRAVSSRVKRLYALERRLVQLCHPGTRERFKGFHGRRYAAAG